MDLGRLAKRAKEQIDRRGGTESLKEDADELRSIANSKGSSGDKARRAADALREPGAPGKEPKAAGEPRSPER
jgi:hypothetical protein